MKTYLGEPLKLLDEADIEQNGEKVKLPHFFPNHTWVIKSDTGSKPAAQTTILQGSLTGVKGSWYELDRSTTVTSEIRHVANKAVKFIRARLHVISGGGSPVPTVSIWWLPAIK
ncbi:hypothetical protein LCGC14_0667400 [marine sediment metagenome]|uniref:Uncharacterized protein n=1 Tax=marine sediment metagenome TaxID=412755 RepID=A0A0F9QRW7_9ZZZZ